VAIWASCFPGGLEAAPRRCEVGNARGHECEGDLPAETKKDWTDQGSKIEELQRASTRGVTP
jgi:hypothetical protein